MYPLVSTDYQHRNASVNTDRSQNPCSAVIPEPASFKQAQRQHGTSPRSLNREATAAVLMLRPGSYDKLSVSSERGKGGNPAQGWFICQQSEEGQLTDAKHLEGKTGPVEITVTPSPLICQACIRLKKKKPLSQTSFHSFTADVITIKNWPGFNKIIFPERFVPSQRWLASEPILPHCTMNNSRSPCIIHQLWAKVGHH